MYLTSSIARSGMNAAQVHLDSSAHNVANAQTPNFHRQTVVQQAIGTSGGVHAHIAHEIPSVSASGVTPAADIIEQIAATYVFKANALVLDTANAMIGTWLDEQA